jgi:putative DNA primase/helicase
VAPETTNAATLLAKVKAQTRGGPDAIALTSFTPRQIVQKGWAGLVDTEAVRKAADLLVDYGWLRREIVHSADELGRGRTSERYVVHPTLL